jgi:hypothetical protein
MVKNRRSFWISLSLINLCIVAFLGFTLRSKILFSLPFIDYRKFISAHSHFAFSGWVGLSLITLLLYDILTPDRSQKKIYQWILAGIEVSSLGMAIIFPIQGYCALSIFFSSLYILLSFVFAWVFIKDVSQSSIDKNVKLLSISAIASLIISSIGPFGLSYILISGSGNSILYRDSIYTFLHFQYNGFFTLAVFALFFAYLVRKGLNINSKAKCFSIFLCLSIIPSLFLSLLWHNKILFYFLAALGCLLILISLVYFFGIFQYARKNKIFLSSLSATLWILSFMSFGLKMLLHTGTIFPQLGNAVYGDRPVIIGFLHLIFLGFVTFYVLCNLIESDFFTKYGRMISFPFIIFAFGIIANELLLLLQGLGILFNTNNDVYKWLLWCSSILLFLGPCSLHLPGLQL